MNNLIEAIFLVGPHKGEDVGTTSTNTPHSDRRTEFKFKRLQFAIR